MPALKLDRFLSADGSFQPVIEKAREIDALSKLCSAFWPPELARLARVANIKDGTLVVLAANGPAAAKLKLLGESLGQFLSKQGAKVNSVSVRVQPGDARETGAGKPARNRCSAARSSVAVSSASSPGAAASSGSPSQS